MSSIAHKETPYEWPATSILILPRDSTQLQKIGLGDLNDRISHCRGGQRHFPTVMATALRVQDSISLERAEIGNSRQISGDRTIAESTVANVATFLLEMYPPDVPSTRIVLQSMKIKPLADFEILQGIRLIEGIPFVLVVPDDANRCPRTGRIIITRRMKLNLHRDVTMLSAEQRRLLLAKMGRKTTVELVGVS